LCLEDIYGAVNSKLAKVVGRNYKNLFSFSSFDEPVNIFARKNLSSCVKAKYFFMNVKYCENVIEN
jgi:hypothetical protein